jgi:hypothetical protein
MRGGEGQSARRLCVPWQILHLEMREHFWLVQSQSGALWRVKLPTYTRAHTHTRTHTRARLRTHTHARTHTHSHARARTRTHAHA